MPVEVGTATAAELSALSVPLAELPLYVPYGLTAPTLAERWTHGLVHGEGLLVARRNGELLGLAWYLAHGTFASGAYLRTLAVVPQAQGQGVGRALLAAFEHAAALTTGGYFLLASDFNPRAHRFYERHGYAERGRLPGFAAPGVTEVIFWKPSATQVA